MFHPLWVRFSYRAIAAISLVLSVACSTTLKVPDAPILDKGDHPEKAWARVLSRYVDKEGRVDFYGVKRNPRDLHAFVHYVSNTGPKTHPATFKSLHAKLAFHINAYNALSMYNVIEDGVPKSLSGFKKVGFFYFTDVIVDREEVSLYAYENEIIRPLKEERIHFALNCMSAGCPRLPQKPFTSKNLERELQRETKKFFNEDRNVRVDHKEKKVYLSEILDFFTEDFIPSKAKSLIHYANKYRTKDKQLPVDYEVDFIDYDWTIYIQPGTRPKKR